MSTDTMLTVSGFNSDLMTILSVDSNSPVEISLKNLLCFNIQSNDPKKLRRNINYKLSDKDLNIKNCIINDLKKNLKYLEYYIKNYKKESRENIQFSKQFILNSNYSTTTNNPHTNFHKIIGSRPSLYKMRELYRINHVLRSLLLGNKLEKIDSNFMLCNVNRSPYNSHLIDILFDIFDAYYESNNS